MDAKEYIQQVALATYETFKADPTDYSKLHAAIDAFNAVPEHIAHARLGYAEKLSRSVIHSESERVREQYPEFCPIKDGAEALKHVRLAKRDGEVIYSSTGITPSDPTTRVLDNGQKRLELRDVLDKAASILSSVC